MIFFFKILIDGGDTVSSLLSMARRLGFVFAGAALAALAAFSAAETPRVSASPYFSAGSSRYKKRTGLGETLALAAVHYI